LKRTIIKYGVRLILVGLVVFFVYRWMESRSTEYVPVSGLPAYDDVEERSILTDEDIGSNQDPSYLQYYHEHEMNGVRDTEGMDIRIPGVQYARASERGVSVRSGIGGYAGQSVVMDQSDSWVEYRFEVTEDGFYQMGIDYYALEGKRTSVVRKLEIDGAFPFLQARRLEFTRIWKEDGATEFDDRGNESNPPQVEVFDWQYRMIKDPDGKVTEPLRFYLSKGEHTLRISYTREPAAIREIRVFSPIRLPDYATVKKEYDSNGYRPTSGHLIIKQAEEAVLKSSPTIRRIEDREPSTQPFKVGVTLLNAMGGFQWRSGGQWIEWEVDIPESGLYEIGARFGNWLMNGISVQRTVYIDGKIPFRELNAVTFPYSNNWQVGPLGGGEPYLFYLEKGTHRIRMEVQMGAMGEVTELVQSVSRKLSLLSREVLLVTGVDPDPNRQWRLENHIPNLVPRLHLMVRDLDSAIQQLIDLGVPEDSTQLSALIQARDQIYDISQNTETIPARIKQVSDTQSSLGQWVNNMSQQGLFLDFLIVKSPDVAWPRALTPWYKKAMYAAYDFFSSFTRDYNTIGDAVEGDDVLEVWVARGRDWTNVINTMVQEDFTSATGIKVRVSMLPVAANDLLTLALVSGRAPDVALGVGAAIPIDFALRGGLLDLTQFPDFEQVAERFTKNALVPYTFNGGVYALPESQNFLMLFYRTDIMQELGVEKTPETWDEVFQLIPMLQQRGMDFYYAGGLLPFLFQNDGEFYLEDGKYSGMDAPEGIKAWEMYTELYTKYRIAQEANFYNRFRTGEMPIGVGDYTTYIQFNVAAPELTGWWKMAPLPGIRKPDGTIDRSAGGVGETAIIFRDTDKKEEAWEFLKWWTDAPAQERFGYEMEAIIGPEARWNTANLEAIQRMPWDDEDINVILEQWKWFRERVQVPGGYYTDRYLTNIWNDIVLGGKMVREAVEDGVKQINKELQRKRQEFNLDQEDESGSEVVKP
jgi:ABC-type glycerol-3-phosphate transport system substrate-binding protein